jgi:hydrogenase-4 component H
MPPERYRGQPKYNEDQCVGCGACSEVCTTGCIKMTDDLKANPPKRNLVIHYDSCIFCGQCQAGCITKEGVKQTNKLDDLSVFDREEAIDSVEKELVLCEGCGCLVGAKEHLAWVARKLGPLAYSSPTAYLSALKDLKLAYLKVERSKELTRQDRVKILCPTCRREITLET